VKNGSFITSDGVKLRYLDGGTGSTILFVPGWTMPAEIWQLQMERKVPLTNQRRGTIPGDERRTTKSFVDDADKI